ncbi:hypothetical protein AVEN_7689-1 [Araneus ventricosus]|uniref:Retrovirus-related Pol polyprotein from transposon TNT 1-94-like beta-barrel domain-containing protein n=1 Tax=Araneus ventricosus TaxID=182803 RepID=A0A4Y2PI39_ARAVE|nr:hypothetical protein AVEN_7689-1 [Araneus ventricosus]
MKRNCRYLTRKKPPFKEEKAAAVSFVVGEGEVKKFIVDSGVTFHMCSQREWFEELKPSSGTVSCVAKSSFLEVAGHSGKHALRKLGLPTSDSFCENCFLANQSAEPIGKGNRRRESAPMKMIHSDLCGPVETETLSEETERAIGDKYPEFRSQTERKPPMRYAFNEALSATNEELTYDEIKFLPEEEQSNWKSAMDDEMLSMEKNKVWDLVEF